MREYRYGLSDVFYGVVPSPCFQIAAHSVCPQRLDQTALCWAIVLYMGCGTISLTNIFRRGTWGLSLGLSGNCKLTITSMGFTFFGQRGSKIIDHNINDLAAVLEAIRPSIILLQYGSNDLAHGINPQCVFSALVDMAIQLQANYDAIIGILSVVPRVASLSISPHQFELHAQELEGLLKPFYVSAPLIFMSNTKGSMRYSITEKNFPCLQWPGHEMVSTPTFPWVGTSISPPYEQPFLKPLESGEECITTAATSDRSIIQTLFTFFYDPLVGTSWWFVWACYLAYLNSMSGHGIPGQRLLLWWLLCWCVAPFLSLWPSLWFSVPCI